MYPATVVWVGATSARVVFDDGAMKTLSHEELASPSENSTGAASVARQQIGGQCTSGRPNCYCKSGRTRAIVRYDPETGDDLEEYCSTSDAAQKLGLAAPNITHVLSGTYEDASGHKFRYKVEVPSAPPLTPTDPCAICMSTITEDACILECGHAFHAACLGDLADHVRLSARTRRSLGVACPLCRKVTRAEVGAEES